MMTSSAVIMPRSPWLASAGCTNSAGVPVEDNVAAILWPTCPDLPMPETTTRPRATRIMSTAAVNAGPRPSCMAAVSAAIPPASASSVRSPDSSSPDGSAWLCRALCFGIRSPLAGESSTILLVPLLCQQSADLIAQRGRDIVAGQRIGNIGGEKSDLGPAVKSLAVEVDPEEGWRLREP